MSILTTQTSSGVVVFGNAALARIGALTIGLNYGRPTRVGWCVWSPELGGYDDVANSDLVIEVGYSVPWPSYSPRRIVNVPDAWSAARMLRSSGVTAEETLPSIAIPEDVSMLPPNWWLVGSGTGATLNQRTGSSAHAGANSRRHGMTNPTPRAVVTVPGPPGTTAPVTISVPRNYANALRDARTLRGRLLATAHSIVRSTVALGGVPPFPSGFFAAIAYRESRFSPTALSSIGAAGPFQLVPSVYEPRGVDPTNWREALPVAMSIIRTGLRASYIPASATEWERQVWAHERYARGPGNVRRQGLRADAEERVLVVMAIARIFEGSDT